MPTPPQIRYQSPVLLIGGGGIKASLVRPLLATYPIIAVDGGADVARKLGANPEAIIGDFDSLSDANAFPRARQIRLTDQNSTDLEKALSMVSAPLGLGFGFLGKRFDHSLAALHAIAGSKYQVVLVGRHDAVHFSRSQFTAQLPPASRVSIWPLTRQAFTASSGLVWDLAGLCLQPGAAAGLGTSNRVVDGDGKSPIPVTITPADSAGYFVIVDAHHWACLPSESVTESP